MSHSRSDQILIWTLRGCAVVAGAIVVLIVVFLGLEALPVLQHVGLLHFFTDASWNPAEGLYNLTPMLWGTLWAMVGSVLVATPIGILSAVFCHYYAPPTIAGLYRRLSAAALGFSRTTTLWQLLLPAAVPGLMVGFVLGIGRAIAETAALIFTSGYVDRMPESLLDSGRALSIHIYDLSMNVSGGDNNAYASALVLLVLLLLINGTAAWMAEHWLHRRITPL